jgi:hypothetical protein
MSELNDFDLFIGLILAKLYEERGHRPDLSAEDFGLLSTDDPKGTRWDTWQNTLEWLAHEGYVRHGGYTQGSIAEPCFLGAELTEKGFRALNSIPAGLAGPEAQSLGRQLVGAAKQAGYRTAGKWAERGADEGLRRIIDIVQHWMS